MSLRRTYSSLFLVCLLCCVCCCCIIFQVSGSCCQTANSGPVVLCVSMVLSFIWSLSLIREVTAVKILQLRALANTVTDIRLTEQLLGYLGSCCSLR